MKIHLTSLLVLAGASVAFPVHAELAVSNLWLPFTGDVYDIRASQFVAMNFTTGPGTGWPLESLYLMLDSVAPDPGTLTVSLNADASGLPGTLVAPLSTPVPPSVFGVYQFSPGGSVWLAPATTYWVVASGTAPDTGGDYGWAWAFGGITAEVGLPGWTILDGAAGTFDGGASWEVFPAPNTPPAMFAVEVPESHGHALTAGLGLLGLAAWRRRRA